MFLKFSRYTSFGVIGFLIDFTVFNLLYLFTGVNFLSRGISYLFATVATWSLNTAYTFDYGGVDRLKFSHYIKYLLSQLPAMGINITLHLIVIRIFGYSTLIILIVFFINGMMALLLNFFLSKHFIFKA